MPNPIFAVGLPVPNGSMEYKSDGLGESYGVPDGYRATSQFGIDMATNTLAARWTSLRRGVYTLPYAAPHASRGRAYSVGLLNTATVDSSRYIDTPANAAGYLWGADALNAMGVPSDNWWIRLRFWFLGIGVAPSAAALWRAQVIGYPDAVETSFTTLATVNLDPVADWATGVWTLKASAPFQIVTAVHHTRVRLAMDRGPSSAGRAYGCFTDLSVETLGPIDSVLNPAIAETLGGGPTLSATGAGGTYYQLTKGLNVRGYKCEALRFGKSRRLPSGAYRTFDPSGGAMRRRFTVPLDLVSRADYNKLYRIWLANKGWTQETNGNPGASYPILFSPQTADEPGFYYCSFEGEEFPLREIGSQGWMAGTEAGQLYRGTLILVEN